MMRVQLATIILTALIGNAVSQCLPPVGTKEYCPDHTALRTWKDAEAYCEANGRTLATIRNKAESDALIAAYDETLFGGEYWVAGRDIQEHPQFVWSLPEGNTAFLDVRFTNFMEPRDELDFQTCLVYASVEGGSSGLKMTTCTTRTVTLCEQPVAILNATEHEHVIANKTYFY